MKKTVTVLLACSALLAACNSPEKARQDAQRVRAEAIQHFVQAAQMRFVFRDAAKRPMVKPLNESDEPAVFPDGALLLPNADYFRLGAPQTNLELVLKNTDIRVGISTQSYATADRKTSINPRELEALIGASPDISLVLDGKPLASVPDMKKFKTLSITSDKLQFSSGEGGILRSEGNRLIVESSSISAWKKDAPGAAEGVNPRQASLAVRKPLKKK